MKLCYRGVNYEDNSLSLEVKEGEIAGKYRGQDWKTHYPSPIPTLKPKLYRQYRGIAYGCTPVVLNNTYEAGYHEVVVQSSHSSPNLNQVHQQNLKRSLERRLARAIAKGDQHLVQLLQQECEQLNLL